jgi:hypothetical protein
MSVVKDEKAYVFGGRSGNKDIENLVEIDLSGLVCSKVEVGGKVPKGRRKPGLCMRNNSIFCFSVPTTLRNTAITEDKKGK